MASGDQVTGHYIPGDFSFDTSAPPDSIVVGPSYGKLGAAQFDYNSTEAIRCLCFLGGNYADGGLTLHIGLAPSASVGGGGANNDIRLDVQIRRYLTDGTMNVDTDDTWGTQVSATVSCDATGHELKEVTMNFTDGLETDNLAKSEAFLVEIQHDHDHGADSIDVNFNVFYFYFTEQ